MSRTMTSSTTQIAPPIPATIIIESPVAGEDIIRSGKFVVSITFFLSVSFDKFYQTVRSAIFAPVKRRISSAEIGSGRLMTFMQIQNS